MASSSRNTQTTWSQAAQSLVASLLGQVYPIADGPNRDLFALSEGPVYGRDNPIFLTVQKTDLRAWSGGSIECLAPSNGPHLLLFAEQLSHGEPTSRQLCGSPYE